MSKFVFIAGTGRSGTHLLGRSISSHDWVDGRIEEKETFNLITRLATTQDIDLKVLISIEKWKLYKRLDKIKSASNSWVLEKSHPCLWLAENLMKRYPDSLFFGIERDAYGAINSMLQHSGIISWYDKLPLNRPNRFLGITEQNVSYFSSLSLEEKCCHRWISHHREMKRLHEKYSNWFYVVNYSDLITQSSFVLSKIAAILEIPDQFNVENLNNKSLEKWKHELTSQQKSIIETFLEQNSVV